MEGEVSATVIQSKRATTLRWLLIPVASIASCAGGEAAVGLLGKLGTHGLGADRLERLLPFDVRAGLAYGVAAALFVAIGAIVAPRRRVAVALILYALGAVVAWPVLSGWYFPEGHPRAYTPSRVPLVLTLVGGAIGTVIAILTSRLNGPGGGPPSQ